MKLGCVVLASGFGRRFGENKLLAPFRGQPLVDWALAALPLDRLDRVVVVTRWPQVAQLCQARGLAYLIHQLPCLSDTIRLGLEAVGDVEGCLFLVGDQPLCSPESLNRLVDAFLAQPDRPARLAWQETPGNPVLFPKNLFPALLALEGEKGGGSVLSPSVTLVEASHPEELADADSPEALARLESSPSTGKLPQG